VHRLLGEELEDGGAHVAARCPAATAAATSTMVLVPLVPLVVLVPLVRLVVVTPTTTSSVRFVGGLHAFTFLFDRMQ